MIRSPWIRPLHRGEAGVCLSAFVSVCVYHPPLQADFGPMSLMQFWTKLYSQLGRPLPKVLVLFTCFALNFFTRGFQIVARLLCVLLTQVAWVYFLLGVQSRVKFAFFARSELQFVQAPCDPERDVLYRKWMTGCSLLLGKAKQLYFYRAFHI